MFTNPIADDAEGRNFKTLAFHVICRIVQCQNSYWQQGCVIHLSNVDLYSKQLYLRRCIARSFQSDNEPMADTGHGNPKNECHLQLFSTAKNLYFRKSNASGFTSFNHHNTETFIVY